MGKISQGDESGVIGKVLSTLLMILGVCAILFASGNLVDPPFTDAELQENFVDTWEAYVLGGTLILGLFSVGLLTAGIGCWFGEQNRSFFLMAFVAFAVALVLEFVSLERLTQRTEVLLGHELHWLI